MRRSKKTLKLRVTGLCAGNSPVSGELPAQTASGAENVFIWWRHHEYGSFFYNTSSGITAMKAQLAHYDKWTKPWYQDLIILQIQEW